MSSAANNITYTPLSSSGNNNININGRRLSKGLKKRRMERNIGGLCQCKDGFTWILGNCSSLQQVQFVSSVCRDGFTWILGISLVPRQI
jgi:hypothetical protein